MRRLKIILALLIIFSLPAGLTHAQEHAGETAAQEEETEVKLDPGKVVLDHIIDAHEFHFATLGNKHFTLPLPIILWSEGKLHTFMSSKFHHGTDAHEGFMIVNHDMKDRVKASGGDPNKYLLNTIVAVDENKMPRTDVSVVDLSLTKNATQMIVASILLVILMVSIANKYKREGPDKAPSGIQGWVEPVITFIRDDVAKPALGKRWKTYMPLLLSVFFFILINALIGMLPGAANPTGNLAFTGVLALISLVVILFSTNKGFWGHVFWFPGVPIPVKLMMLPVELMGIITKPFALMIRLFANMVSGHVIILSFVLLIFIFGAMNTALGFGTSPIFILLAVFIFAIKILVIFIQAYIFTNLTAVFIGQAFEHEGHHEDGKHQAH